MPVLRLTAEERQVLRWLVDQARRQQVAIDPLRCYGLAQEASWSGPCGCVDCLEARTTARRERRHRQKALDPDGFRARENEYLRRRRARAQQQAPA